MDHSPISDRIRGLLCTSCNTGLRIFKPDEALLNKILVYVRKASSEDLDKILKTYQPPIEDMDNDISIDLDSVN